MEADWFFTLLGIAIAVLVACLWLARVPGRWGRRRSSRTVEAGTGPYRAQQIADEEPSPVPGSVGVTASASVVWGLLTLLIFAPAGALLLIMFADANEPAVALAAVALLGIELSGFALGATLIVVGFRLMRRSEGVAELAHVVTRWSRVHHAMVAVFFTLVALVTGEAAAVLLALPFVWLPCGIGFWVSSGLQSAGDLCATPIAEPTPA